MKNNTYNLVAGGIIAFMSAVFGVYWYLFAFFLVFNILDWGTGWYKAYKLHKESSKVGLMGAVKKVLYWVLIAVSFAVPIAFQGLGKVIGLDLSFLTLIGWFTLSSMMINEARSILENLVEVGVDVPKVLIKGLAVTDKLINSSVGGEDIGDNE